MATLTTPKRSYPYPDGAERVMDGDNAIGALAAAVDADVQRLWTPPGVIVSGASFTQSGATQLKLPLDTVIDGMASLFDNPNDQIVLPAGGVGLWHIWAWGSASVVTPGNLIGAQLRTGVNGGTQNIAAEQSIQTSAAAPTGYWSVSTVIMVPSTYAITLWGHALVNQYPTWLIQRFGAVRIAAGWGTSVFSARELEDVNGETAELGLLAAREG